MKNILKLLSIFIVLSVSNNALAGGPLLVSNGEVASYGSKPLVYRLDQGELGKFTNGEAIIIFKELFAKWEGVSTSTFRFQESSLGLLDFDVNGRNFDPILNSRALLGYTPIVFDDDGSVTDGLLGYGSSDQVLGVAGPVADSSLYTNFEIVESFALINGRFINGVNNTADRESTIGTFKGTILHELGHAIGLDHSQINVEALDIDATQEIRDSVPLEFPRAVNDLYEIRRDDASSLSFLYPNKSELLRYGKISGKVLRGDGTTPVLGANIIARNIDNPKLEAISCVSDFLDDRSGSFTLFAIPPGKYRIEIEPINPLFKEGSGIGPHTSTAYDKSFTESIPKGYYIGANLPITTDENKALVIEIQAGQEIGQANIIAAFDSTEVKVSNEPRKSVLKTNPEATYIYVSVPPNTDRLALPIKYDSSVIELIPEFIDIEDKIISTSETGLGIYPSEISTSFLPTFFTLNIDFKPLKEGTSPFTVKEVNKLISASVPLEGASANSYTKSIIVSPEQCYSSFGCGKNQYCDLNEGVCYYNSNSCTASCSNNSQCSSSNSCVSNCCVPIYSGTSPPPSENDNTTIGTFPGVICIGDCINEQESNNSIFTSQPISLPSTIIADASPSDIGVINLSSTTGQTLNINDIYSFKLSQTVAISANLIPSFPYKADLDLVLLDSQGKELIDASSNEGYTPELINKKLLAGSYLLGVGAFEGSSAYKLEVKITEQGGTNPFIDVADSHTIFLTPSKRKYNIISIPLRGYSFSRNTGCGASTTVAGLGISFSPKRFSFNSLKTGSTVIVKIPYKRFIQFLGSKPSINIKIKFVCSDGTEAQTNLSIAKPQFSQRRQLK